MNRFALRYIAFSSIVFCAVIGCNPSKTAEVAVNNTAVDGSDKIVFINIDSMLNKYDLYLDKKSELEKQSKSAEQALVSKIEAFQRRYGKFQQEISEIQQKANTIAPIELKKMEEKYALQQQNLAKEEEALMKQRENAAVDLEQKLQVMQKDLQEKIDTYLAKIADQKGYDFVLMKGSTGNVMYGKKGLDITEQTVKTLNEEYAQNKTKAE